MKKTSLGILSVLITFFFLISELNAQIVAGEVPAGTSIQYPDIFLSLTLYETDTIAVLDLNEDELMDVSIWFSKGFPPADNPHLVLFYALGNRYSFCEELDMPGRTALYSEGDSLCGSGYNWGMDSIYIVDCYGSWNCRNDTADLIDLFLAYRNNENSQIGWIKISDDLHPGSLDNPITFEISSLLTYDLGTHVSDDSNAEQVKIIPNPTADGLFTVHRVELIRLVEIFNTAGQMISAYPGNTDEYLLPDAAGIYTVRIHLMNGRIVSRRVVRL